MTNLAAYLRQFRRERAWTLREASTRAGVSLSYLGDIERGRALPGVEALERLLHAYGYQLTIVSQAANMTPLLGEHAAPRMETYKEGEAE